jgi:hypothetical protein
VKKMGMTIEELLDLYKEEPKPEEVDPASEK